MKDMKVEWIELEKLIPYVNNPKEHPEEQVKKIASSIKNFGFRVPILIDAKNEIIAGHGRYLAAKLLGLGKVPVIRITDLTEAQKKAFRIADNKVAESGWDLDTLTAELEQLKEMDFDLQLTGFDEDELDELFRSSITEEYNIRDDIDKEASKDIDITKRVEVILTIANQPNFILDFAEYLGFKLGINSNSQIPQSRDIVFVDNDFKNYDFEKHLRVVKKVRPKYATVRDYIPQTLCKQQGIKYYSLEEILEQAEELSKYAENIIIIPKDRNVIFKIPDDYILGYSVPTEYGGSPFSIKEFQGRRVHLLGGSPELQYVLAVENKNVVSLDNNYILSISNRFCHLLGHNKPFKEIFPFGSQFEKVNTFALIYNIFYIYNLFTGRCRGEIDVE